MAVSEEEAVRRAHNMASFATAAILAIPVIGDLFGLFGVLGKVIGMILAESKNRFADLLLFVGLIALFYAFYLFLQFERGLGAFVWVLVIGGRFLVAFKGLPWIFRRIEA
jgi:hypothetical protein